MFVRKKKNKSGKISVQVIDKASGRYRVAHTVGSSADTATVEGFVKEAKAWIAGHSGALELDFTDVPKQIEDTLGLISSHRLVGYDLLLGRIFDEIGFAGVGDGLFRELVIARVAFPRSKLKTTEFLARHKQLHFDEDQIYRYMDRLHATQKEKVQQISFEHTQRVLGGEVGVVFYDVTTLYFEIDREDELRRTGFSKDGRHRNPQIVLGLLVGRGGYPLAYEIFEGNRFEGHTMLPVIDAFKQRYGLGQLVVVADSGLLSKANVTALRERGQEFILGARIKNEPGEIKEKILSLDLSHGQSAVIEREGARLIVTYSDDRAKKDRHNREKGLGRLEKLIRSGRLTKANISNRGYNKFLKMEGELQVAIDREKVYHDARWDGLKGYLTNTRLHKDTVIENYGHLWMIERAFRINKNDLKIRPMYHRLQRRIEAHICITFTAYKVYKELERQLHIRKAEISANRAIEIAGNIYEIAFEVPNQNTKIKKLILLTEEQKYFASLFGI